MSYTPPPPPASALFRREDVARSDFSRSEELRATLQSRLRLISFVFAAVNASIALSDLGSFVSLSSTAEVPFSFFSTWFCAALASGWTVLGVLLRAKRPRALGWLRACEAAMFTFMAGLFIAASEETLTSLVGVYELAPVDITLGRSTQWVGLIVAYGTLIPNTARRTAVAMVILLAASLIPVASALADGIIPSRQAFLVTNVALTFVGSVAVMVWFGSFRYETVARREAAARELGQYVLGERLGAGGMGEVYHAEHRMLRRPVAVKLITPAQAGSPDAIARFEREAQATAGLTHPNTVQIFDYGRSDDGTFYCVMEYLPGDTLEAIVHRDGPMAAERAVHVLTQVCGALAEAHAAGLVHRDIKPSNVMMTERGGVKDVAKLLDFGLVVSGAPAHGDGRLTEVGMFVGTPEYMSPEQCAGGEINVGPASDLYSLGALGYYLLTGRSPFAGRSATQMLAAHLYETPKSVVEHADVPLALAAVLEKCLAKSPDDRFVDAGAVAEALRMSISATDVSTRTPT